MKRLLPVTLTLLAIAVFSVDVFAQCSMCQATAETSLDAGATTAAGLNKGIMYLFFTPYLIIGTVAYFWWRARRKAQAS